MRQLSILAAVVVSLTLVLATRTVVAQQGPVTLIENRFEAWDPPAQADVLQVVLDFPPGAWTPVHTHGGPVYVTVLEGEVTLRINGMDQKFTPGQGWIDNPDEPHAAGNDTGALARVVATFVLPPGATPTTNVATGEQSVAPPGPITLAPYRRDAIFVPSPLDVIHRLTEIGPGATVPTHIHPGPNLVVALQGELAFEMEGGQQAFRGGDNWLEPGNAIHGGTASTLTQVVSSTLAPRGAPVAVPVARP